MSTAWWRDAVFYENHMASFRDANGDGIGDIAGLTASLDYLHDLGIGAVWLSPCFKSPMLDQGFDISDYTSIEPLFGTLEEFGELLAQAHSRGIRIIADYVPNHTSDQHPWFVESRASRTSAKRDWYVWKDPRPDGSAPTNWTSEAGGSVWQFDAATGQYYLHSHLPQQPDLNWRNPEVVEAMLEVLRYWLDFGVDGFRIDVAHMLMKDPLFRDNPVRRVALDNMYDAQHPDFASQEHIYDRMHPDVHTVLQRIRATIDDYDDKVLIGEIEAMDWPQWATYFGTDLDEIHLPFAFRLIETPWGAEALATELEALYAAVPAGGWPILALGNHDRPRLADRIGPAQLRSAATLLMTLRGTPIVFYGDELGLHNQDVPPERQRDYFGLTDRGVSRDPIRTPMPWNNGFNAGFSTAPSRQLWLPISLRAAEVNVSVQRSDPASLLNLYRALTRLRAGSPALRHGAFRLAPEVAAAASGCLAFRRLTGDDHKLVILNLTDQSRTVTTPAPAEVVFSTHSHNDIGSRRGEFALSGGEGVILSESQR
ncbi:MULTISPECIES: alpha-amylase family glycosyl hydrolase [unclassified Mycolicibacterium]|uniref:alpha-amylase family glycosyl hydrolase n=1 Tax=unclassified Mycolicibacterium TaxID=2636767 RepID=UPI002EDA0EC6